MDQSDLFLGAKYLSNISSDASPFPTDIESPKSKFERDGVASSNKVYDTQIWTRHLLLYGILGNIGMLFTVISPSSGGVLSAMFCVGTYGHVFMEGSILLRLISTSNRYKIQQFHGIWGLITLFNLLFFSESFGQLSWAAESILTDSMSLMAGFYLMQSDVDKQVKYIALSHFIHGITFELFLWCDIAGMNANITTERGVWWVILVVANASCQILFHCPVIRGKVEINPQKPQTPTASEVRFLVFLWVLHGIFTIPTVLSLSTAAGNNFYLSKWVSEFYLKMIYLVPMVTLMYTLACFVDNDKNAHATSIWSELGFQEPERFAPRAASGRGYMEDNAKTHKGYNRAPSAGSTHTDALPSAHTMEKNEVRKFFSLFPVYQMLLGISFLLLTTWDMTELADEVSAEPSSLLLNVLPMPLAVFMLVAGLLGSLHGAGVVTPMLWRRTGSSWYMILTSLSLLLLCTAGLLQWLHIHELKRTNILTAEVGLVCGLLYLLWGGTVLFDRAQEMISQCTMRKN